jgi:N-acetylglucosamine-6-sulfatase
MKKIVLPLAAMALAVLLSLGVSSSMPKDAGTLSVKPNIVFILADDMRKDDLRYMPKTRSVLKAKGMSFENAFVSNALCCPARATIMRGQYSHNTHVWTNGGSSGGWQAYRDNGNQQDNVATRLDAAGYRTALFGKYLNGYKQTTGKPLGWDRWFAHVNDDHYYDYQINDDGTTRHYGSTSADYETDVIADHAKTFIGTSASAGVPFFAYVAPKAPHNEEGQGKPVPAPRDRHVYDGLKAQRSPSFNERDVSDKPRWIRKLPRLSDAKKSDIDDRHEKRAESLQAVDDLVAGVVGKLRDKGVLSNTYIFFTSDNGWHEGEHRLDFGKWRPYEEDIHVPLLVRGPGVAAGHEAQKLALDTDFLPTFTNLACSQSSPCDTQNWSYVPDGRSLKPVLDGNATAWRSAILLEAARNDVNVPNAPAYRGIRTDNTNTTTKRKYVKYSDGSKKLYYLKSDPYELADRYKATSPPSGLVSQLGALKTCAGNGCRAAENGQ